MHIEREVKNMAEWYGESSSTISKETICNTIRSRWERGFEIPKCLINAIRSENDFFKFFTGARRHGTV